MSMMSAEFRDGFRCSPYYTEWLIWCGGPMLYDGGLCVNREVDEVVYSSKYKYTHFLEF